jgi:hypothetical protein
MTNTIVDGVTTDVRPRGRYISGFCWAIYKVTNHPTTEDWTQDEQKSLIKDIEEMMALATYGYSRDKNLHRGSFGLVGTGNLSDDIFDQDGVVDLDEFELLSSDYAVETIQANLRSFRLREGELGLTGAGTSLAEAVDGELEDLYPELLERSNKGKVSKDFIDEVSSRLSLQAIFDNENFSAERDVLQKIALGILEWENDTVALARWPAAIEISIDEHMRYVNSDRSHKDDLRNSFESQQHHLRRGWFLFILRAYQMMEKQDPPFTLDDGDVDVFGDFLNIARVYWLQVHVAYALRAQLSALCTYIEQKAPRGVNKGELLDKLKKTDVASDVDVAFNLEVNKKEGKLEDKEILRDLVLAEESTGQSYSYDITGDASGSADRVEDIRVNAESIASGEWNPVTTDGLTLQSTSHIIDQSLQSISTAPSTEEAISAFGRVLSRTTVCLFLSTAYYTDLMENNELLREYISGVYNGYMSSVVQTSKFINSIDEDSTIEEAAVSILDEKVIETHERVVRNRLNTGGPLTMSFDFNIESSSFRTAGGVTSPTLQWLRLKLSRVLLRDAGLLTYNDDIYTTTEKGERVLERLIGGGV